MSVEHHFWDIFLSDPEQLCCVSAQKQTSSLQLYNLQCCDSFVLWRSSSAAAPAPASALWDLWPQPRWPSRLCLHCKSVLCLRTAVTHTGMWRPMRRWQKMTDTGGCGWNYVWSGKLLCYKQTCCCFGDGQIQGGLTLGPCWTKANGCRICAAEPQDLGFFLCTLEKSSFIPVSPQRFPYLSSFQHKPWSVESNLTGTKKKKRGTFLTFK